MKSKLILTLGIVVGGVLLISGCTDKKTVIIYDDFAPSAPRGVVSYTGDGYVLLTWFANPEPDVVGYDVYKSTTDCSGPYYYLASTSDTDFVDYNVANGNTYFYAIAAYDWDDFQSDLSYECIHDTPRPEGVVVLFDFNTSPNDAGFDFSSQTRVRYDSPNSDFYFEYYVPNQTFYLNADAYTDIQDFGYADTLAEVGWAPSEGWSDLGYAEAILGHVYILRIWNTSLTSFHYAKIRINELGTDYSVIEWAYQVAWENQELKPIVVQDSIKR